MILPTLATLLSGSTESCSLGDMSPVGTTVLRFKFQQIGENEILLRTIKRGQVRKQFCSFYQINSTGCRLTRFVQGFRCFRPVKEDTTDGAALLLLVEDRTIGDRNKDNVEGSVDKEGKCFSVFFVSLLGVASDCRLPVLEVVLEEFIMVKA